MIAISESQISAEVAAAAEVGLSHHAVQPVEDPEQPLSWIAAARNDCCAHPLRVLIRSLPDHLEQEPILPAEVLIEGPPRNPSLLEERVDPDPRAVAVGEPLGSLQQAVTRTHAHRRACSHDYSMADR